MRSRPWLLCGLVLVGVGVGAVLFRPAGGTAQPAAGGPAVGPKYTIVDTEGMNLLVVDNSTNTVYFYTVEPDKGVGDDLHLRGTVDLNEVGKPVIKPKGVKKAAPAAGEK